MELKKVQEDWNSFPAMSMEERPVLSSDLEKMMSQNPFTRSFYLKNKILARISVGIVLWLIAVFQLRIAWKTDGPDLYQHASLLLVLSYFIYSQIKLLYYCDYSSMPGLTLMSFLGKIETILDKYILSFRLISLLTGFYGLFLLEKLLSFFNSGAYTSISQSGVYKWLIIAFGSLSAYILFLQAGIPKYKKSWRAVRSYKEGILAKPRKL